MKESNIKAAPKQGAHPSLLDKAMWMEAILARTDLIPSAKLVAVRLALHHNTTTGRCDPSLTTLAKGIGTGARIVHTAITSLRESGLLSWVTMKNGRNSYTLESITIGQTKAKSPEVAKPEPLHSSAIPLALQCKGEACSPVQTNTGNSNPGRNPLSSVATSGTGTNKPAAPSPTSRNDNAKVPYTVLPDTFTLTAERRQIATKAGLRSPTATDAAFLEFRKHHQGAGTRSPNWDAKWESWCIVRMRKVPQAKVRFM